MIAIITVIPCCAIKNEKEQKKAPSAQPHQSRWGSREKGGNIMGAIRSFLCSCKHSANVLDKQE
jgi:hypothetical protein